MGVVGPHTSPPLGRGEVTRRASSARTTYVYKLTHVSFCILSAPGILRCVLLSPPPPAYPRGDKRLCPSSLRGTLADGHQHSLGHIFF